MIDTKNNSSSNEVVVCGVCNPILDILYHVDDEILESTGKKKAGMYLQSEAEQDELKATLEKTKLEHTIQSGGSVANSIHTFSQLVASQKDSSVSCRAKLVGRIGSDKEGELYHRYTAGCGVEMHSSLCKVEKTGTSYVLVTPDSERTMFTHLGAAGGLTAKDVPFDDIKDSTWIVIEGYLIANQEIGVELVKSLVEFAKDNNVKIAFTCSDSWVVSSSLELVRELFNVVDLFVGNADEVCAFTGLSDPRKAFDSLKDRVNDLVVTLGSDGVLVSSGGEVAEVPSPKCKTVDLTGAGDVFLGSYLYGLSIGATKEVSAHNACKMASLVIQKVGPRLEELPDNLEWV